jgi:hypothetical protein
VIGKKINGEMTWHGAAAQYGEAGDEAATLQARYAATADIPFHRPPRQRKAPGLSVIRGDPPYWMFRFLTHRFQPVAGWP